MKEQSVVLNSISNLACHFISKVTEGAYKRMYLHRVCVKRLDFLQMQKVTFVLFFLAFCKLGFSRTGPSPSLSISDCLFLIERAQQGGQKEEEYISANMDVGVEG